MLTNVKTPRGSGGVRAISQVTGLNTNLPTNQSLLMASALAGGFDHDLIDDHSRGKGLLYPPIEANQEEMIIGLGLVALQPIPVFIDIDDFLIAVCGPGDEVNMRYVRIGIIGENRIVLEFDARQIQAEGIGIGNHPVLKISLDSIGSFIVKDLAIVFGQSEKRAIKQI